MILEPINLVGEKIKDAYFQTFNTKLIIEFESGKKICIHECIDEDEISGNDVGLDYMEISTAI